MNKKLKSHNNYDNVNLLTVLFTLIVLYEHHIKYAFLDFFWINFPVRMYLVNLAVGGFFFLSAYKLTKTKKEDSFSTFWKNRLLRIYPLYLLAVFLFTILNQKISISNTALHILGLQMIFPNLFGAPYSTLYFVSLLFLYYLLFSLTKQILNKIWNFIGITLIIFILCLMINIYTKNTPLPIFSDLFLFYFYFFVSGMICSYYEPKIINNKHLSIFLLTTSIILSVLYIFLSNFFINTFLLFNKFVLFFIPLRLTYSVPIYLFLLSMDLKLSKNKNLSNILSKISYSSFAVYLFHRPIWTTLNFFLPEGSIIQWIIIVPIGIIIIFLFSYNIQKMFDSIPKNTYHKKVCLQEIETIPTQLNK